MKLSAEQHRLVCDHFEEAPTLSSSYAWSRRQYAPMHIHTDAFDALRCHIAREWPDHTIAFDVVFEAPPKRTVDWHCDYESLGPFDYDSKASIDGHHFVSVHFNLTPDGGCLHTLDWPRLSYLYHLVITQFGIYSRPHAWLNAVLRPLFTRCATRHTNDVNVGNSFDNMRLHSVSSGASRLSYVVRLVRRGECVWLTPSSVSECATRSSACTRLTGVIAPHVQQRVDAGAFAWESLRPRD